MQGDDIIGREMVHYALRGSMRIVWPHCSPSYSTPTEAMKLCLPTHFASGGEEVDVRMSYEFAINPRGTPVDLTSDAFTDDFFAGCDAKDLFLALLADVGSRCDSTETTLYIESDKVVVLALLRCGENMHLHSNVTMYHSSSLDPVAVEVCRDAFERSALLARCRAFKLEPQEDILVYSCLRERPEQWLFPLPKGRLEAKAKAKGQGRKRAHPEGGVC
mmetsp:Transcript_68851/g.181790  ORF Transcript_68851/g.181790 Transcript_68851/m.181790 type:complete len:218 (+) Transcript_68851:53-706(+)